MQPRHNSLRSSAERTQTGKTRRILISFLLLALPAAAQADMRVLNGKFNPEKKAEFTALPGRYSQGKTQYLDTRALEAFLRLAEAARKAGYEITVISATRNFASQKAIWEQKFNGTRKVSGKNLATAMPDEAQRSLEILRFSSMPGTSRHHWGTDFDLHESKLKGTALTNETLSTGRGLQFYEWLTVNAPAFGFCQPYKGDPAQRNGGKFARGYQEERWHWSYKPVSAQYLKVYLQNSGALAPVGFAGDRAAAGFYLDYVQNIDPGCL